MTVDHRIGGDDTVWVFVTASQEPRHLQDIAYGVSVLRGRGVLDARIFIFADHAVAVAALGPFNTGNVHPISALETTLASISFRYIVAIVGGHGSADGLQSSPPTSPHAFFAAIRSIRELEVGAVFLCQCYAGVFDFTDADAEGKSLVIIGSATFYPTISSPIALTHPIHGLPQSWIANIYQLHLFQWLRNPRDIDGDGEVTLVDAYKAAGVGTIRSIQDVWVRAFSELHDLQTMLSTQTDPILQQGLQTLIRGKVSTLYNIQEPWLLHARLARRIGFV